MVKVYITLPNSAQITFESEEPEVIHEIVGMVLRDLPRELMQSAGHVNGNGAGQAEAAASNGPVVVKAAETPPEAASPSVAEAPVPSLTTGIPGPPSKQHVGNHEVLPTHQNVQQARSDAERDFVAFCQSANPMGDMRRVVVAAEGAGRYLQHTSVNAEELGRLFDLVGWQRPHSFVQTLRNAARSKFRWLERVPGRSGQYTVTDRGRSTALSS